jgi:CHAD domain-containing protein
MSLADTIVAQVLQLEMGLYHAYVRLQARTDCEALHDLRIHLRRLRSLLRPLRKIAEVAQLDGVAAEVGALTSPVRDLEVLIHALERQGCTAQAQARIAHINHSYSNISQSAALERLLQLLNEWPSRFRSCQRAGDLRKLKKHITHRLRKQIKQLRQALLLPQSDRHQLRLLIKKARYATAAYPQLSPCSTQATEALKQAQAALGDWHDYFQWCRQAEQQADLQALLPQWRLATETALNNAEIKLLELKALL